jgi:hypothetical protein
MKLPNPEKRVVEREKIANYLLNPAHRFGASTDADRKWRWCGRRALARALLSKGN